MSLYTWDTKMYNIINTYFRRYAQPLHFKRNRYSKSYLIDIPPDILNMYIANVDLYKAGIQVILNLGVIQVEHIPEGDYGMLPDTSLDSKHLRQYIYTVNEGQIDYFYPYKKRTVVFS